jgi:AsmA protein
MISRLGGSANFAFSEGALRGIDVRGLNEGVAKAVLQGWSAAPADKTPFDRLEASFAISDGIAESKDLIFEGGGFRITGSGQSDLLKGDLDFRLKPVELDASGAAKTGGLNGLNLAIAVKGPWNEPRIYPDVPGILENPAAAYEQIKSLLANAKNGTLNDAGAAAIGTAADSVLPPDAAAAVKKKGQKLLDKLLKKPDPAAQ